MNGEVLIRGISCDYKEYRLINGHWVLYAKDTMITDNSFVENMVSSGDYFTKLGGYMSISYTKNRRFNIVPNKVVCVSICQTIKKVFSFNYNQAQVL